MPLALHSTVFDEQDTKSDLSKRGPGYALLTEHSELMSPANYRDK